VNQMTTTIPTTQERFPGALSRSAFASDDQRRPRASGLAATVRRRLASARRPAVTSDFDVDAVIHKRYPARRAMIAFERHGSGEPLLLIHGTGIDRRCWDPVIDALALRHELLVIDLPGHGASPLPPPTIQPNPIGYAALLSEWLDGLGLDTVHVAGNSVGGWTALELAKRGRARSVIALAPAGLWARRDPFSAKAKLWLDHQLSRTFRPVIPFVLQLRLGRTLFMGGAVGNPARVPPAAAIHISQSMGSAPGFSAHLRATTRARFEGGRGISVPVTVAWGEKEKLIPDRARRQDQLPRHVRWLTLPGCGHLPFWDDPDLVASTIIEGAQATVPAGAS